MIAKVIEKDTKLFGLLADLASTLKKAQIVSDCFLELGVDAAYIPMNIREDDIYFTIAGLKNSKISAINLGSEYVKSAYAQMDTLSDEAKLCGFVDTISIKDEKLHGYVTVGKAYANILKEKDSKKIIILGSGSLAKSILMNIKDTNVKEVILLHDRIESSMQMLEQMHEYIRDIGVDIDRYEKDIAYSADADMLINATSLGKSEHDSFITFSKYPIYLSDNVSLPKKARSFFEVASENSCEYIGGNNLAQEMIKIDCQVWFKNNDKDI